MCKILSICIVICQEADENECTLKKGRDAKQVASLLYNIRALDMYVEHIEGVFVWCFLYSSHGAIGIPLELFYEVQASTESMVHFMTLSCIST